MNSKVSVCIPVYNGEKTIQKTVESVMQQTYKNLEILIIDNQSTDNTVQIVSNLKDDRIVFFQNSNNIGMAGNWNECLKKATGEYIHFLCADDYMTKDCIEKKVTLMDLDGEIAMVSSSTDIVNENGELVFRRCRHKTDTIFDGYKFAKKSLHRGNLYGEPSNVMFRKKLLETTGLFSTNLYYTTDWELWVRLSALGKVAYLRESLTKYRISTENTTSQMKLKKILQDDDQMMINLIEYGKLTISRWDIIVHKIALTIRDYIRFIYMKIKSK